MRIKMHDQDQVIPPSTQRSEMKSFFCSDLSLDTKDMTHVKARQDKTRTMGLGDERQGETRQRETRQGKTREDTARQGKGRVWKESESKRRKGRPWSLASAARGFLGQTRGRQVHGNLFAHYV